METKFKNAIEEYQCSGCVSGCDISCFETNSTGGVGCGRHTAAMPFEPLLWAVLLQEKDYDAGFKDNDLSDLMDMKYNHDEAFKKWCNEHYYAGSDDEMSNDLQWLGKAIKFFVERGYIKNCP